MSRKQREELDRQFLLTEHQSTIAGMKIDYAGKTVSFDPELESDLKTATVLCPGYLKSDEYQSISMFRRAKPADFSELGNPLIWALKNMDGWRFKNSEADILMLLTHFIQMTGIGTHYDTLITIPVVKPCYDPIEPQVNEMVSKFLYGIKKLITSTHQINKWLTGNMTEHVYEGIINWSGLHHDFPQQYKELTKEINGYFTEMDDKNNGIFSFKYIKNKMLFRYFMQMPEFYDRFYANPTMELAQFINDQDVLILDRTITGGGSEQLYCKHILDTYVFRSATVITLFDRMSQ